MTDENLTHWGLLFMAVALVGLVALFGYGCGSQLKTIDTASNAAHALRKAAAPGFNAAADAAIESCKKRSVTKAEKCPEYIKARDIRRAFYAAIGAVHLAAASAAAMAAGGANQLDAALKKCLSALDLARKLATEQMP